MVPIRRATTAALIVCLLGQATPLFASDEQHAQTSPLPSHLTFNGEPLTQLGSRDGSPLRAFAVPTSENAFDASTFAQFRGRGRGRGRGGRGGRNEGAAVAIFMGVAATIAGSAILVYANRPECRVGGPNNGCGYGTKVAGGAVLTAGLAGIMIGAITWR